MGREVKKRLMEKLFIQEDRARRERSFGIQCPSEGGPGGPRDPQPDPRGPPEMGILELFGRRGPPGGGGRDPQPNPRGPLASDNR